MVESLLLHQRQFLASSCSKSEGIPGSGLRQAAEIRRIQHIANKNVGHSYYSTFNIQIVFSSLFNGYLSLFVICYHRFGFQLLFLCCWCFSTPCNSHTFTHSFKL